MNGINLFPDQQDIIDRTRAAMRSGKKQVLIRAETGAGKTIIATSILHGAMNKGSRTWFIVPRRQLLTQTAMTYQRFNIPHSYIAAGEKYSGSAAHHICSLQTIPKRIEDVRLPDLAIMDETHYGGGQLDTVISKLIKGGTRLIGLSATPVLPGGEGMDKWYDEMIDGLSLRELIRLGRLSDYDYYEAAAPDRSGLKASRSGEYTSQSLDDWTNLHGKYVVGNAIKLYKEYAAGQLCIHFAPSIEASKAAADAYTAAGIPAAHMDGETDADVRRYLIDRYAKREILILCNVDLMTFGFDLAAQVGRDVVIEAMIDAAPTKSLAKQRQKWGRVLRWKPKPAVIFDLVGNCSEHMYPCTDIEWSLSGKARTVRRETEREVKMRQCDKCGYCHPPAPLCPNCGHKYPIQSRQIKEVDGEVRKVDKAAIAAAKKDKYIEVGRAKTMDDLWRIAKERGYKSQWVRIQSKVKGIRS